MKQPLESAREVASATGDAITKTAGFWGVCLTISCGLAFYFWRKGWIGK